MTTPEQRLLDRIASKDQNAMSEFYDQFHAIVYNFAVRRMREPADAAEVLNQVMLEVWKTAHRFEGRSKVQTWLLGITHHKIIDNLRKISRHEGDEIPENYEDDGGDCALDLIALGEHSQFIKNCMDRLSSDHKEVIHLAFFEDLIYAEIAQIIDRPEGTVKTRMYHAKIALKKCLENLMK